MKMRSGTLVLIGCITVVFVLILVCPNASKEAVENDLDSPNTSDYAEPNDSFYDAYEVVEGSYYNLDIGGSNNYDYFSVYVNRGYRLIVDINWSSSAGLDLALYDYNFDNVNNSYGYSDENDISYVVQNSGTYYIRVYQRAGIGTTTYQMGVDPTGYVDPFSPMLFWSIFTPILIISIILIIIVGAVHRYNQQKVIHPRPVGYTQPWQRSPQPTPTYVPQPPSYAPYNAPPHSLISSQQPVVFAEAPKQESKGLLCTSCGARLEPNQKFCQNCGVDLESKQ